MAGETTITVVGNLTADPELRFTPSGAAVASFTVAATPRTLDKQSGEWKDGDALFMRCNIWRQAAENVAESLTRGARVIVTGRLRQRSYETKEGEKRTVVELEVDEVGPSCGTPTPRSTRSSAQVAVAAAVAAAVGSAAAVAAVAHRSTTRGAPRPRPAPAAAVLPTSRPSKAAAPTTSFT